MSAAHMHPVLKGVPAWVPLGAQNYLAHTENGLSIRALARASELHPSTILRQVRRIEGRRDDPLVDAALRRLSAQVFGTPPPNRERTVLMPELASATVPPLSAADIDQEAKRILRRLCEQGALLAVAEGIETAVVVRCTSEGEQIRTAVVETPIAQAMALKDWITCKSPGGRVSRYTITNAGRAALRRLTARDENRASGFVEQAREPDAGLGWTPEALPTEERRANRPYVTESPLIGLSRRRDKDGKPFLSKDLIAVGERLREDFELAEMGQDTPIRWDEMLEAGQDSPQPTPAAQRMQAALAELGPGLGHIALRCCCYLEGLEQTEKHMGWSARSGKIVLRIALQRLKKHYETTQGQFGPMIG